MKQKKMLLNFLENILFYYLKVSRKQNNYKYVYQILAFTINIKI